MFRRPFVVGAGLLTSALLLTASVALPELSGSASAGVLSKSFTFVNNSGQTIWVGLLNNPGQPLPEGGGFRLDAGTSHSVVLPDNWAGRFWPRTGCSFDSNGN